MNDTERAAAALKAVCDYMDGAKLEYERHTEKNTVLVTITGNDFPVTLMFTADPGKQRIETYSEIPFVVRTEKTVDLALACAAINGRIAYGKFCLYPDRNLCTYENSEYLTGLEGFSAAYGGALVAPAYSIVEEYNEKLYAVNKGLLSVREFVASLRNP